MFYVFIYHTENLWLPCLCVYNMNIACVFLYCAKQWCSDRVYVHVDYYLMWYSVNHCLIYRILHHPWDLKLLRSMHCPTWKTGTYIRMYICITCMYVIYVCTAVSVHQSKCFQVWVFFKSHISLLCTTSWQCIPVTSLFEQSPCYCMCVYVQCVSATQGYWHCFVVISDCLWYGHGGAYCSISSCCADGLQLVWFFCCRETTPSALERELAGLVQRMQEALANCPQVGCQVYLVGCQVYLMDMQCGTHQLVLCVDRECYIVLYQWPPTVLSMSVCKDGVRI